MILRSTLNATFAIMMCLSLICSMSIQVGHADNPIAESAVTITPLGVGDRVPKFVVKTADEQAFEFDPLNLSRPAVLLTFRGGWCPFCNMHLSELRHVIPEIDAMGVDVLFLSGDRADVLYDSLRLETQEDIDGLDYTILSDSDAQAAIALGVAFKASDRTINRRRAKGDDIAGSSMQQHGVLPVPAVFAVDKQGTIQFAYTNADYKVRLPAAELVSAAAKIAAAD